jgi:DNA excision repair protein ERCC-2
MKHSIRISVGALAQCVLSSGDLSSGFLGSTRPGDGIAAHRKIQNSRGEEYLREVTVTHSVEIRDFVLEVNGKIDGIIHLPDHVIIEEIKTTHLSLDHFDRHDNPLHWSQLKIYAYIYSLQEGLEKIDAQLTYYQLDSDGVKEIRRRFTRDDLESHFLEACEHYVGQVEAFDAWCALRDEAIRQLTFPFADYRPGQRQMATAVYRKIQDGGQLIIQGATGIGKTMAVLFPAIKALAEGHAEKIFYLTARTTGRVIAEKTLDELRAGGLRLRSVTLTAKDKICFRPDAACSPEECEYARGYYDRFETSLNEFFRQDAITREVIEQTAGTHRLCPFESSLDLSLWADCIICDYNYVFDPKVYLRRFFLEQGGDYVFLIDEAHNLVDRAREMFSAEIQKTVVLETRRPLKEELPEIHKSLGKINAWLLGTARECTESGGFLAEKKQPSDLYPLLEKFLSITDRWLSLNIKKPYREALSDLYFSIKGFLRISEHYDDSYATMFMKIGRDLRIKLFCMDPSVHLERVLKRCKTAVFFSATMTPAHYFMKVLGCDESADGLEIPSPFPTENLCLLLAGGISTLYRQRAVTKSKVTRMIDAAVGEKQGNYLIFFPSYEYMKMVHNEFQEIHPGTETIVQTYGLTEDERDRFLQRFSEKNHDTLVGFVVMGGIFGEGIDLVGDRLSGAVVVGVGLPAISPERELIRSYFAEREQAGFEYSYVYPGMNRVLQAAGRVIRSENDRGVVLLIDKRFSNPHYRGLLPKTWRPFHVRNETELKNVLEDFWNRELSQPKLPSN